MATDLKSLREYDANVHDYDPVNPTYKTQVDRLLNEADRRICTEKLYTFAQKTVEVSMEVDVELTGVAVTSGSPQLTHAGSGFASWMPGQVVEIEGRDYTIAWVANANNAYLTEDLTLATGNYSVKIMNRFIHLPQDCVQIMSLARRSNAITPSNPGLLEPLSQYEDEWSNLPLGETGIPENWVPSSPVGLPAPRDGVQPSAGSAFAGRGVRTIEVAVAHQRATYLSALSNVQTISLTDLQDLVVAPGAVLPNTSGLYRKVYLRAPLHGLDDWRPALNLSTNLPVSFAPNNVTPVTVKASLAHLQSEEYYIESRLVSPSGVCDRVRLYPRQSEAMTLQLRYLADHQPMVEDNDTSAIPPAHRMVIAYRALYEVLFKHDNPSLSELYYKRYQQELLQLERRYLSQPSRRLVKGFLSPSRVPDGPYRRRKLVRL